MPAIEQPRSSICASSRSPTESSRSSSCSTIAVRHMCSLAQPQDVAVDVIADVEDLLALDAGHLLERDDVAALIDLVARQVLDLAGGADFLARRWIDLHERPQLVEERRLRAADDDDVEVVAPRRVRLALAVEQDTS